MYFDCIICNPPFVKGKRLGKKLWNICEKYGKEIMFLKPTGALKNSLDTLFYIFPLHTSRNSFDTTVFPLGLFSNIKIPILWDLSTLHTLDELSDHGYPVYLSSSFKMGKYLFSGITTTQELTPLRVCFSTQEERLNFIKNEMKMLPLNILYSEQIFPKLEERLLPPVDREYSKEELCEYFGFPWDSFQEIDDLDVSERKNISWRFDKWSKRREEHNITSLPDKI